MYPPEYIKKPEEDGYYLYPNCGYLIVLKYDVLLNKYKDRYAFQFFKPIYAIQHQEMNKSGIKYHGIDRDALRSYEDSDNLAEIRLHELEELGDCIDGILWNITDVEDVMSYLENSKNNYEIIWTRIAGYEISPPKSFASIGFEPSFFRGDHFSASCDCMMFPRWHGTDKEGILFLEYFKKLNIDGMFENSNTAKEFLNYYLSFTWTETGKYEIVEVFKKIE